jgi:orotidine-5'-phosphate decarboxylase
MSLVKQLLENNLLLISDSQPFKYSNGGEGFYYIDLRRGPSYPNLFQDILDAYSTLFTKPPQIFVGVPSAGIIYATGLAIKHQRALGVWNITKQQLQVFSFSQLLSETQKFSKLITDPKSTAFVGLQDVGIMLATMMGLVHHRPSAILRRSFKSYGCGQLLEADLEHWKQTGVKQVIIFNDPLYPVSQPELFRLAWQSGLVRSGLQFNLVSAKPIIQSPNTKLEHLTIVEDLWTTGTSSYHVHKAISNQLGVNPKIIALINRLTGVVNKFKDLKIDARARYDIATLVTDALNQELITETAAWKIKSSFSPYTQRLVSCNDSGICVGLDILPDQLPDDYEPTLAGMQKFAIQLLEFAHQTGIRVVKPNFGYWGSVKALKPIIKRARELDILVILDAKIGDISKTQGRYAREYQIFDAVTVHGYLGSDSIEPVIKAGLGCYVVLLTSNPSRDELETFGPKCQKIYQLMARQIVTWQKYGSVGAVIGGTGELKELRWLIKYFARELNYLPPLLIPGIGTQGGSAPTVMEAIKESLKETRWSQDKLQQELRKVVLSSSSAISLAKDPKMAMQHLVKSVNSSVTV